MDVLTEAREIVHGDRQESYGHPLDNHGCTAGLWSAWLTRRLGVQVALQAEDVASLNILQKLSRQAHEPKRDNLVDVCGYAANVEMIQDERESR